AGSAGADLVTAESVTIQDTGVVIIPTTITGPLGRGLSALVLGRSSATKQGIFVQPGVIDSDYKGVIKIMVRVLAPPLFLPAGSVIAQLIPFKQEVPLASNSKVRDLGHFGSTGPSVTFTEIVAGQKPVRDVTLRIPETEKIALTGGKLSLSASVMMDTGSDITII
ncbi:hypothetical protein N331_11786, partial [Merops nubicus]